MGSCCPTRRPPPLRPELWPQLMSPSPPRTLAWVPRRPASSRPCRSPPRLPRVLSRSSMMCPLSPPVTRSASEATLLGLLKIFPFSYGLIIQKVYDQGSVFDPAILDITDDDIKNKFMAGVANVAAVCLAIGYPTMASAPHSIANGMKNLLAIAAVTEITFKEAEMLKEFLADPSKFAAAAAPAAAAAAAPAAAAAKVEEEEEEEDDDMGFGLFD